MRSILAAGTAALSVLAAGPAVAQSRPDSLRMSCAQVAALVKSQGAVVLGTGPNIYARIVANPSFCPVGQQQTRAKFIQARDNPQCFAGYECRIRWRNR
jgi:hypothetical protein